MKLKKYLRRCLFCHWTWFGRQKGRKPESWKCPRCGRRATERG